MADQIEVLNAGVLSPVILSVPHGGTRMPSWCRRGLIPPAAELWSDWYTGPLYDLADRFAVPVVRTGLSRFVADPNRPLTAPRHGSFWTTAVPATDPSGRPLYRRPLTDQQLGRRIRAAHQPYHRALDRLLQAALEHHRSVLLIDLHSFGVDLAADVVLGDGNGTTAAADSTDRVLTAFVRAGFTTVRNRRFSGGHIVRRFAGHGRVQAIQVELSQRCYLRAADVDAARPRPRRDPQGWRTTRRRLAAVLESLL